MIVRRAELSDIPAVAALERAAGAVGGGVVQAVRSLQVVGVHGKPDSLVGRTVGGRVS